MDTLNRGARVRADRRGFSLIEILIAIAIAMMTISAAYLVAFGDQSAVLNAETNAGATTEVQRLLEQQEAFGRDDFNLVNATSSTTGIYHGTVNVQLQSDFLTKLVSATVAWPGDRGQSFSTTLSTLITDLDDVNAPDTCDSNVSGDWRHPKIASFTLTTFSGVPAGSYQLSDLDAFKGRLYVTATKTTNKTDPTLFVFDISNPASPILLGSLDNATTTIDGLSAVRVAEDAVSGKTYAYVTNAHTANFSSCAPGYNCAQLQVIDVSDPQAMSLSSITNYKIPGVSGSQGVGESLAVRNGYVYLGLAATGAGNGPEFHIIDIHDPLHPAQVGAWPVSGNIGNVLNALTVRGQYAYLAHPAGTYNEQVTILNINDPGAPFWAGSFYAPGGIGGNGKSLALVGDSLYLGRTASNISGATDTIPEFYMLDDSNLANVTVLATTTLATADSVDGIVVRDSLVALATNSRVRLMDVVPGAVSDISSLAVPSGGSVEPSLDCEDNVLYVVSNTATNQGTLSVVTAP